VKGGARVRAAALTLLAAAVAVLAFTFLVLADIELVAGRLEFYRRSFARSGAVERTGLDVDRLTWVIRRVLDYSTGRRADLQFDLAELDGGEPGRPAFIRRELDHMRDVRALFEKTRVLKGAALGAAAAAAAALALLERRAAVVRLARAFAGVSAVIILGWAVCAAAALADFGGFWDLFHEVLFTNDLWLLPQDSLLIKMLPESLFRCLAFAVLGLFAAQTVVILGAALWWSRRCGRRNLAVLGE
jgi:integral membrane protein (TIGR01906 family)